jgi:hypothetical protein
VIGNANDNTIKEIWTCKKRHELLELLRELKFSEIGQPCQFCLDGRNYYD